MKQSVLFLSLLLTAQAASAHSIQGVVRDAQGTVIPGAAIDVVGTHIQVIANENGEFVIDNLPERTLELHVKAPRFAHRVFHLSPQEAQHPLSLTLSATVMEIINVVGLPWHASNIESAQPVQVLKGERLRQRQAPTLGDTLAKEVGVHSNFYGGVSSSPIIRGLDGPRVLITQNSLDAGDASRVGPDHAVATESVTARQIEVLRGPSTLFYGSGAIGGVVNIVDDRVPSSAETRGEWRLQYNSVSDEKLASGSLTSGAGDFAYHVDGFWRDAGDYKLPHGHHSHDEDDHDDHERLENSAYKSQGLNLGGSYLLPNGHIGVAYGRLERRYGIPGHDHGHDHGHGHHDEDAVYADLKQDRWQMHSELTLDHGFFSAVNTRLGYTDYRHHEIEGGQIFTTFENRSLEARVDLFHHLIYDWRGAFALHYKHSDFSAEGEEAFSPPSKTETLALGWIEERHFGDWLVQLGARAERVSLTADRLVVDIGSHSHPDEHTELWSVFSVDHQSSPFSLSAGAVWDFTPGYNLAFSLARAQRTPSAAELLSFGPHIGSRMFEVGALLTVHDDGEDEFHFDLARTDLKLETSHNLDISLRKYAGDVGFIVNLFYNSVDNYYYLADSGFEHEFSHGHDHDHGHHHDEDTLPVFVYQARDAQLYGFEGEWMWRPNANWTTRLMTDYIRAKLRDGGNIPRIPPMRVGGELSYQNGPYSAGLELMHYFKQNKAGERETTTSGYSLIDAQLSYSLDAWLPGAQVYLHGKNLADTEARVHSSFLKDEAPLPGRAFLLGVSGRF